MQTLSRLILIIFSLTLSFAAHAMISMELTRGVAGAIPIAVVPFATEGDIPSQNIANVISNDLQNSGRFKVLGEKALNQFPSNPTSVNPAYFQQLGTDNVVIGRVDALGGDRYQINFHLMDMYRGKGHEAIALSRKYTVSSRELRAVAHHISDLIYERITGVRGIFSTRIAYVVVQRVDGKPAHYTLEVSDQDGYSPRPLLSSSEPIMSPAWSPNGKQLAYVSFENKLSSIYVQDVATGARQLLSHYPGINGAPSWSPDGRKLALVLSKSGSPNIYVLDLASRSLRQVTKDFYINTEPSWSPDGRSLLFTSNRGGSNPQIYQVNLSSGAVSRVSYDGDYNARAIYTPDGNHIAMIHRASGIYNIGILDLDSGTMRVLTSSSGDSASPSVAPNGSMILFDTVYQGHNMLGMVSADGRVQLVLPARNGEAQDPAWSPFS